ncbi:MAG: hypothetical protein M1828_004815 [Chrysothrix sp. TS-e1954]|nr:MAG: hypothetical protein M1828_004815 [Chrysothrix sp. TS-e1954]
MSFWHRLRQRRALPIAAGVVVAGLGTRLLYRDAFAEAPDAIDPPIQSPRKPIYDDPVRRPSGKAASKPSKESQGAPSDSQNPMTNDPTPTDRLAVQVRQARLFMHNISSQAETSFNAFMTRAFNLEDNFTTIVRSLAPPADANEPILPGLAYIFVAALAGTIVSRNRGIILRASVPLTFGIAAGYAVLPSTMQNVEGLMQDWEGRYSPELRQQHIRARERVRSFLVTGVEHSKMALSQGEEAVGEARKSVEDWVRKGR